MFWGNFDINKDWFDYLCGVCSCFGAVAVPFLVWYFGASRVEGIKERKQQIAVLDYLVIASNEIMNQLIALLNVLKLKEKAINEYLLDLHNEEKKEKAFATLAIFEFNADIKFADYNFTTDGNPYILKLLFKYKQYYNSILAQLERFNTDLRFCQGLPITQQLLLLNDFLEIRIVNLKFIVYIILYTLKNLTNEIERYNNDFMQSNILYISIPENTVVIFEEAEDALSNRFSPTNPDWRSEFIFNPTTRRNKISIWTKINNIFINPK